MTMIALSLLGIIPALLVLLLGIVFVSVPYEYVKNAWFLTWYVEGMSI